MIKQPAYLKKGDKIAIVCPASRLPRPINKAIEVFQSWELEVVLGESVTAEHHQFAGTDELRRADLQRFMDDPSVSAIIAGRGGYGCLRIIDELDFTHFVENPKWIVGFSDVTVLLSHLYAVYGIQSIHGPMPYTFDDATSESLESLRCALFGEPIEYGVNLEESIPEGVLIGGNLTMLVMLEGSQSAFDYTDKILFIEDIAERPASIDRMMRMLKRAGRLSKLNGLIVGAFNELPSESIPYGHSPNEIIHEIVGEYNYPVYYDFQVGHIEDNRAIVVGKDICFMRAGIEK